VRWLKVLAELLSLLSEAEEFLLVHDEAVEKLLRTALEEVKRMREAWEALQEEDKLVEVAARAPWRKSRHGEGEYVPVDAVPLLAQAVKARQGRLYVGDYVYVISKNGKWIQRYQVGRR